MEKESNKAVYNLWWRYLQQSPDYKQWLDTYSEEYRNLIKGGPYHIDTSEPRFRIKWTNLYGFFGNIHTDFFDDWWTKKREFLNDDPIIGDYAEEAGNDIRQTWIHMKNRPSDPEEFEAQFRKDFVERIKKSDALHIIVDPDADLETLKARFLEMVKQKREERKDRYAMHRRYKLPIAGKLCIDDLEKYLRVYVLKEQNKDWDEIISEVSPFYNSGNPASSRENIRTVHGRYYRKAKTVIRNAEDGKFPGNY